MTKRKLSRKDIDKMIKGRKNRKEKTGLVCKLDNRIEVWADLRQYILRMNGYSESYFYCLNHIMDELLERKTRELAVKNQRNDLIGVREAVVNAQGWMEEQVKPLLNLHSNIHPSSK